MDNLDRKTAMSRNTLHAALLRFFDWRHLVAFGAACCLGLSLLFYLYVAVARALTAYVLFPLSLLLFGVMLWHGRLFRFTDIKLLLAAFVWMNISCLMNFNRVGMSECIPFYANACAIALLCYPLAYALDEKRRIRSLDWLAGVWIVPVACSSVVGIVLALTQKLLFRSSDSAPAGMYNGRLWLILDPNMYALLLCTALCLVLYLLLSRRGPFVKALLIAAGLSMLIALALTGNRTAKFALLPAAFFFAAIIIWKLMQKKSKCIRLLAASLAGVLFCALLLLGARGVTTGFNALMSTGTSAQTAMQDSGNTVQSVGSSEATMRDLSDTKNISSRFAIWRYALDQLFDEKDVLLRGATPALSLSMFMGPDLPYNHFHNAYLGVLLSYGMPGFLIMAAFLIYLLIQLFRLLFSARADLPLAIRFLPVILLPILIINLFEEMLFTRSFVSELDVWLGIIGGYTTVLARQWRQSDVPSAKRGCAALRR